jgi:hypothetical protein
VEDVVRELEEEPKGLRMDFGFDAIAGAGVSKDVISVDVTGAVELVVIVIVVVTVIVFGVIDGPCMSAPRYCVDLLELEEGF